MFALTVGVALVGAAALAAYVGFERLGAVGAGFAALRTIGVGALLLLLLNPSRTVQVQSGAPVVLLDASLSMGARGGRWDDALDTARTLAGDRGTILRFGARAVPFDTAAPEEGVSRLDEGLAAAGAIGGSPIVVTDGELAEAIGPTTTIPAVFVLLGRDTLPNAALIDVHVPETAQRGDTLWVDITVATWGSLRGDSAAIEVLDDGRRVARFRLRLPVSPGVGRHRIAVDPATLPVGERVVEVRLAAPGDVEPRDDARLRVVTITDLPALAVLVDPADWEGRFLFSELRAILRTSVRGYARTGDDHWVDMQSAGNVDAGTVRRAVQSASLVVERVAGNSTIPRPPRTPTWLWPAGEDSGQFFSGDWYLTTDLAASPLLGALAGIPWDSLPPLTGLVPVLPGEGEWVALTARRGRRGAARAVLMGSDSAGARRLVSAGAGFWRWGFRGGAAREAYRALIAGGIDWLLASNQRQGVAPLRVEGVSQRGTPVRLIWSGASRPDSIEIAFQSDTTRVTHTVRFDPEGVALVALPPAVYRWATDVAGSGLAVVESYSDEFHARPVISEGQAGEGAFHFVERFMRQRWWLFVIAIAALGGEWAARVRRGLP